MTLLLTGITSGQQKLETVDAAVADQGPLAMSLRDISVDLRQPTNFERIYRVPGTIPGANSNLMRANGALYAVFPRSVYRNTRNGTVPVVPDGTVFYIGAPSFMTQKQPDVKPESRAISYRQTDNRLDQPEPLPGAGAIPGNPGTRAYGMRLHPTPGRPQHHAAGAGVVATPTILTDPAYRAQRVRELMKQAALASGTLGG